MRSLNGSVALVDDLVGLTSSSQTGFPIQTSYPFRRSEDTLHVLTLLMSDYGYSHSSTRPRIYPTELGILLAEFTRCWKEQSGLADESAMPPVVSEAVGMFKAIQKVLDVRVEKQQRDNIMQLSIIVDMEKYDDDLMRQLVNTEIELNKLLRDHNFNLKLTYLPWPHVESSNNIDDMDLE